MYKSIASQIKEEILQKIKEGQKVPELASLYGISPKTIYTWLRTKIKPAISFAEISKLRKENEELKKLLGMMMLDLEEQKKRKLSQKLK